MTTSRLSPGLALALAVACGGIGFLFGSLLGGSGVAAPAAEEALVRPLGSGASESSDAGSTARLVGAPGATERAPAAPTAPAPVEVSPAALAAATGRIGRPEPVASAGAGELTGSVTTEAGLPLAGVVLVAWRGDPDGVYLTDAAAVGGPAPVEPSLDAALESAAESWADSRSRRARGVTDAGGAFRIAGLGDGPHRLDAYKDGWVIEAPGSAWVLPGSSVRFEARPVREVVVELRLPDGSLAEEGVCAVTAGRGMTNFAWSQAAPVLRATQENFTIRGFAGVLQGSSGGREVPAAFASEPLDVDLAEHGGGPLVLQLVGQVGVRGRVTMAWPEARQTVVAVPLGDATGFDPTRAEGGASVRVSSGRYAILGLEPGTYAVGAAEGSWRDGGVLAGHRIVELRDGITELDLDVPAPDAARYLVARCLGPEGQPLRNVSFRFSAEQDGASFSGGPAVRLSPGGAYWLELASMARWDADAWPAGATLALTATSDRYGSRTLDLAPGQREATFEFRPVGSLTVVLAGYAACDFKESLGVLVMEASEDPSAWGGRRVASAGGGSGGGWSPGGSSPRIDAGGTVVFRAIEPGRFTLLVQGGGGAAKGIAELARVDFEMGEGDQTLQVLLPRLHDVVVSAPGFEGQWLTLTPRGELGLRAGGAWAQVDAAGHCTFELVPAGEYRLRSSGSGGAMDVVVPTGEVLYRPAGPAALLVTIADPEGAYYRAGLRAKDRITAIDGRATSAWPQWSDARAAIEGGTTRLTVRRGEQHLTVDLDPGVGAGTGGSLAPLFE